MEVLRENLHSAEQERDKLRESCKGLEQQRVNVIVEIDDAPKILGVGYRLYARFLTGEKSATLVVPRFALMQAPDNSYYVYVIREGALERQTVSVRLTPSSRSSWMPSVAR